MSLRPGPSHPWRIVAYMLVVAARQLGNPVVFWILVKTDDTLADGHFGVRPNVRAKVGPTVWSAGTAAQNRPKAGRRRPSVPRRWGSA
jgi:hypothetical protein